MSKDQEHGCGLGEGNDVLLEKQFALRAMQASLSNHLRDAYHWHSSPTRNRTLLRHADWLAAICLRFHLWDRYIRR